ncbi:putative proteasome regulatory particle subunit [Tothia fuscella]|uniref:Proteasome regulatory particle subunit n=1 Tax=Tothia fuscella TaxID=1048955 RepID=A0A9P4NN47_9PEZI|nr:putative proteasome regulatory particle subunit [Tothia fuscella]
MATPQESKYAIHEAAREGRSAAVESLLNANPSLATRRDEDERLPLHWAVSYNHMPIVQLLVEWKDFDVDAQDSIGWTPLMMASSRKDSDEILDLLLARGADVNKTNNNAQTPLHFATSKNSLTTARKLIIAGASTRKKDKRQQLPLHRAAAIGSVPMLKLLLDNKSPMNATDIDSFTGLHHAISEGHGDAALFLLKEGINWRKEDREGNVALKLCPDEKIKTFILTSAEREGIELT